MKRRRLPDFIIIGAQRCGTTSLYECLAAHPSVLEASEKELHYFDTRFDKGREWYEAQFPERAEGVLSGEASPYYLFHPLAARRAAENVPEAKLMVLLRDPVDRAYSHYHHEVRIGAESLSFAEAIEQEHERLDGEEDRLMADPGHYGFAHRHYSYLARGIYVDQLRAWDAHFPRDRILVVRSEDLYEGAGEVFEGLSDFLGITIARPKTFPRLNEGEYAPMNPELRSQLRAYFGPHNRRLFDWLGRDLGWGNQP